METPPNEVGVITLKSEAVAVTREFPGRAVAYRSAEIRPQVSGLIRSRLFEEGSEVQAGQVLYQIESARYQAALDQAEATLANERAGLGTIRDRARRYEELIAIQAVSRQDNQAAQSAYEQAQASIRASEAAVRRIRIDLAHTRISAPITGRIGRSTVSEGALVNEGQDAALALVQQIDPIYVDFVQPSQEWAGQHEQGRNALIGKTATVLLENGQPYTIEGQVKLADASVDQTTGAVTLRAEFPNPHGVLLPGMFLRVKVATDPIKGALRVPQRGVTRNGNGQAHALVVGPGNKVEQRQLQMRGVHDDQWIVVAGLKAGERVIVEGSQRVQPGDVVRAVPFNTGSRS
ncbi:efflux RND transporter periplasmic adaptor subunit [Chitiniphilus eburneus]|uniref:efflux RND transporter periplasmic adaptor subunit n=1 Tax=Chitiniphilus eburneus TaxID=2571148 RepID=UPI0035CFCE4D